MLITLLVYRMEDEACLHPVKYLQKQIQTPQTEDTKLSFGYPVFHLLVIHSLYSRFIFAG